MTTNLRDHSPAIVSAIHQIFSSSGPCHCHGDGKLSEDEILRALTDQRVIRATDVGRDDWLPLQRIFRFGFAAAQFGLERKGVRHVHQLTDWTYADLLALPGVGPASVDKIETTMAKYGLLLKDGRPNRLAEAAEIDDVGAEEKSPEDIRGECSTALMKLAQQMFSAGTSLMNRAVRVSSGKPSAHPLKCYVKRAMPGHEAVARIIAPLMALEAARKPARRGRRRDAPPLVREGKVIRGAFGDGRAA